jgi:hypothetical protein
LWNMSAVGSKAFQEAYGRVSVFVISLVIIVFCCGEAGKMAKSKNHTAHNQSYKNHKNGIKKVKKHKYTSRKGVSLVLEDT